MKLSLHRIPARIKAALRPRGLDSELDEELAYHLEELTKEFVNKGLTLDEARREAQIKLGGVTQLHELHRETRGIPWLEDFRRDFCYACRGFNKQRGSTLIALLIIALGIGLNTTVFSLVNTVLLRPVPFDHPDRLFVIANDSRGRATGDRSLLSHRIETWEGLQQTTQSLEEIEAYNPFSVGATHRFESATGAETIVSLDISPGLFGMLGVKPSLGRAFLPEDAVRNAPNRVLISNQFWRRAFASDPEIVGKGILVNGQTVEIVGVLPPADPFTSVFYPAVRIDAFVPLKNDVARTWGNTASLVARAKPGVSSEQIQTDLDAALARLKEQFPERGKDYFAKAESLGSWLSESLKRPMTFLWLAAGLLLSIVSFNLGGLLLAKGATRQKELSVRCALGASRSRLAQQLLTECLSLVAIGATLGLVLAWGLIHFLSERTGVEIPLLEHVRLDWASLGFTVLLCGLTVVLCGLWPSWSLARHTDVQDALKEEGRGASSGLNQSRTRSLLVILEVALACVLAISAGLMVRSLLRLLRVDLGFQPAHVIAVRIDPPSWPGDIYVQHILDRVRAMPGVEKVGITDCIPVERDRSWGVVATDTALPPEKSVNDAHVRLVSPGLFAATNTPIIEGRDFSEADNKTTSGVIIINQSLAKQMWPHGDALGKQVKASGDRLFTVIAVVQDTRFAGPEVPRGNEMYFAFNQVQDANSWDLMVRTRLPLSTLHADLKAALHDVDSALPLTQIRTLQSVVDVAFSSRRLLVYLVSGFAVIALGLAALGLYGLISYTVVQQTKEIGIRLALGATASVIRRQIVVKTISLASAGLLLGVVSAAFVARAMQSLLYDIAASDPFTYVWTIILLFVLAVLAGFLPAVRGARINPLVALRAE